MHALHLIAYSLFISLGAVGCDLVVVIICQDNSYSLMKCGKIENAIKEANPSVDVLITERDFKHNGAWTILPIIPKVAESILETPSWVFFCTEDTEVWIEKLLEVLSIYNHNEPLFLGRVLVDTEPTIIHHFASRTDFRFPLLLAGLAMSGPLFESLDSKLKEENSVDADFSIDAAYELATYIEGSAQGPNLTNNGRFCIKAAVGCATAVAVSQPVAAISLDSIFFAVKTCSKFHPDRIPVVKETWGSKAKHIAYYSDLLDPEIPTVILNSTNTPHGHCAKTRGILGALRSNFKTNRKLKWAVIVDDDTILSVRRVQELVSPYNSSDLLAIGERYGYNLREEEGYNYLTGGGGIILSRAAVFHMNRKPCPCPAPTSPDDMFLFGVCLRRLQITLVHTPRMHQARPNDYSPDYLSIAPPVSFHKHWMVNPHKVYQDWFHDADNLDLQHTELW